MMPVTAHPEVVSKHSRNFKGYFNKPQYEHFKNYLSGLIAISGEQINISKISEVVVSEGNQSSLNRFLTSSDWDWEELNRKRLELLASNSSTKPNRNTGFFVIDDSLAHKTGKSIEDVGWYFDHCGGNYTLAHQLVFGHYVDKNKAYPVNFRCHRKEEYYSEDEKHLFKSKIELAKEMIKEAEENQIEFGTLLFDSWYLSNDFVSHLEDRKISWVARIKSNRVVFIPGDCHKKNERGKLIKFNLGEYINLLKENHLREKKENPRAFKGKEIFKETKVRIANGEEKTYYTYTRVIRFKGIGKLKIVASFDNPELKGKPVLLASNRLVWNGVRMISFYSYRWSVEVFFKDSKTHLGLESYQLRTLEGIKRHWFLVTLAYTLLELKRIKSGFLRGLESKLQTIGDTCRQSIREIIRSLILFIQKLTSQNQDPDKILCRLLT